MRFFLQKPINNCFHLRRGGGGSRSRSGPKRKNHYKALEFEKWILFFQFEKHENSILTLEW